MADSIYLREWLAMQDLQTPEAIREATRQFDRSGYRSESFLRQLRLADEEGRLSGLLRDAGYRRPLISVAFRPIRTIRPWWDRLRRASALFRRELWSR